LVVTHQSFIIFTGTKLHIRKWRICVGFQRSPYVVQSSSIFTARISSQVESIL